MWGLQRVLRVSVGRGVAWNDATTHFVSDYDCCDDRLAKQPKCLNIDVGGDQFYGTINRTCMDFSRSNYHCASLTSSPWLEQFNEATSFLDCSQVYGASKSRQMALRLQKDGLLATHQDLKDFLPSRRELSRYNQALLAFLNTVLLWYFVGLLWILDTF